MVTYGMRLMESYGLAAMIFMSKYPVLPNTQKLETCLEMSSGGRILFILWTSDKASNSFKVNVEYTQT